MSSEFMSYRDNGTIAENEPERPQREYSVWDNSFATFYLKKSPHPPKKHHPVHEWSMEFLTGVGETSHEMYTQLPKQITISTHVQRNKLMLNSGPDTW